MENILEPTTINLGTADNPCIIPIKKRTPEQKKKDAEFVDKIVKCRSEIRQKHPKGSEFVVDFMVCPNCGDILDYWINDHVNGHIHALCPKCRFGWME